MSSTLPTKGKSSVAGVKQFQEKCMPRVQFVECNLLHDRQKALYAHEWQNRCSLFTSYSVSSPLSKIMESCIDRKAPPLPRKGGDCTGRINNLDNLDFEEVLYISLVFLHSNSNQMEVPLRPFSVAENRLFFSTSEDYSVCSLIWVANEVFNEKEKYSNFRMAKELKEAISGLTKDVVTKALLLKMLDACPSYLKCTSKKRLFFTH